VILGISSATKTISVGICEKGKILAEFSISGKQSFTEDIIVYIDQLIRQTEAKITGIAVASGPGSYSGLRGGMATAKTLAQVLEVPIVEISTLEAIAFNLINIDATIIAVSDARRDEYNLALFTSYKKELRRITQDMLMELKDITSLLSKIKGEIYVCGYNEEIEKALNQTGINFTTQNLSVPKGSNVAILGEALINKGITGNVMELAPKYSIAPNIREFKR